MKLPATIAEARKFQERYKSLVRLSSLKKEPEYIAGMDAAFSGDNVFAVVTLYHYPDLTFVEQASAVRKSRFPYVPGYLFFREGPAMIAAADRLKKTPDLILVDGHGIAHPLGLGSACLLGVLLAVPAIGCAKTRFVGVFKEPGLRKGSWSPLKVNGKTAGAVLRTQDGIRPLFISPGHRVNLQESIRIVLGCTQKYRIPEPLRRADIGSRIMLKSILSGSTGSPRAAKN